MGARQKEIERLYLDEARRASRIFPQGEPVSNDPLDFLFSTQTGQLGIEVTELCRQTERNEGAQFGYVSPKAKRLYSMRPDARPVSVSPVFSNEADTMRVDDLAAGLAEFVYQHRDADTTFKWSRCEDLPRGYSQIGVFKPAEWEPHGEWRYFRAFDVALVSRELIASYIARKNQRVPDYRNIASELWLLIVNDLFLGPGEVCVGAQDLTQWTFDFDFDKVLLFERQPGGSGKVTELASSATCQTT